MTLKAKLQDDMKAALKAQDKKRLGIIRLVLAAIKQKEIDSQTQLDDTAILALMDKMVKQRRDACEQYQNANRQDLADQETYEINVIETYLPTKLTPEELTDLIDAAISQTGASDPKDMGKVIGILKPKVQGRADMRLVSEQIKSRLSQG